MNTTQTVALKNGGNKKKRGEILRLQAFMRLKNLQPIDISTETGVSERTIKNAIYDDVQLGGKLLRALHLNYSVSIDWLLTGNGQMFISLQPEVAEGSAIYSSDSNRTLRIIGLVRDWMSYATEDEQAWLETDLKIKNSQLRRLKEKE